MEKKIELKLIKPSEIPERKTLQGKPSIVPTILSSIPKGQTAVLQNQNPYNISTIRSFIEKAHKKGELTQYTLEQRTETCSKDNQTFKLKTLYVTNTSAKPDKK